jgi:hypothetical protein
MYPITTAVQPPQVEDPFTPNHTESPIHSDRYNEFDGYDATASNTFNTPYQVPSQNPLVPSSNMFQPPPPPTQNPLVPSNNQPHHLHQTSFKSATKYHLSRQQSNMLPPNPNNPGKHVRDFSHSDPAYGSRKRQQPVSSYTPLICRQLGRNLEVGMYMRWSRQIYLSMFMDLL